jgi:transcriptional regulator with XRE-family HTH domain
MSNIGERLKEQRLKAGFTQGQLAQRVGIAKGSQTLYETGKRMPDAKYLATVAELGLDVSYIVTGSVVDATLEPEEQQIVALYRRLDLRARRGIVGAMVSYLADD